MARDIEEFLRRAAERRKKQLKQKQAGQAGQQQQQQRQPRAQPPQRTQQPPRRLVIADNEVEVVRKKKIDLRDESVSQHVSRHLDSSRVTEQASHLAEKLEQADERLEERLHKKFDHDLGSLEGKKRPEQIAPVVTSQAISPLANDLIEMLRTPKTMRQAIIIAEVLKRPNFE